MSKHSPGPWHPNVTAADDLEINDARGRRVVIWYASVECLSPGDPDLIAAAPEMLALLQEWAEDHHTECTRVPPCLNCRTIFLLARLSPA